MLSPPMRTSRPWPARAGVRKILLSASAALLISLLFAFHALLLWQRVLDLSLFKPVPAIRWLATAALLIGLYRLRRRGVSLLRGRKAVVLWLLVLLLLVSFWGPLPAATSTFEGWAGSGLLLALPAISIVLGLISPSIWKLLARARALRASRDLPKVAFVRHSQSYATRAGVLPILSCRPPPVFSH
jgi:hypothetical protein